MPELLFPTTLNLFIYVVFECAMVSEISEDSQCAVKEEIFGVEEDIFVEKYGKSFQCGNKYSDTACFTRKLQMLCAEILRKSHFHPVWNIQKHNIPGDGIKVKFGAKVNSGQIKQSIKQIKIRFGKLKEIKQSKLKIWKVGRNQTIKPWKLKDL